MNPPHILSKKTRRTIAHVGVATLVASVTQFLALPVVALFFKTTPELYFFSVTTPNVISALIFSIFTSTISLGGGDPGRYTVCLCPLAERMPRKSNCRCPHRSPARAASRSYRTHPCCTLGRVGNLGQYLPLFGIPIAFSTLAVIAALIFVGSRFFMRQKKSLFEQLDPTYEQTARSRGSSHCGFLR